ncbi:TRIM2_3 [Mytilus edulis]|uniref:TRIM2_3 n=1 Tax=Mytilus edulis TaxID=6550 RepID=A0A8S3RH96_MYTED|nr:TRIM2_3 [Mytilus edulis]
MKEVLGSVIRLPKISLIHTFDVFFLEISGLVSLTVDICVMYSDNSGKFKYFTISGSKFVTPKDIQDESRKYNRNLPKITDITNYNGELLLSDMRLLRNTGTFEKLSLPFIRDELKCTGIHSSRYNVVMVGFITNWRSAGILELSNIGYSNQSFGIREMMRRVECDTKNNEALFICPEKIITNINGDICVIDRINSDKAKVVVIGKWGKPKWTYSGHPSINSETEFSPNDIITTSSGLVLVAEEGTDAIHVISKEGQFICNCISDSVITNPVSICFDKKDS